MAEWFWFLVAILVAYAIGDFNGRSLVKRAVSVEQAVIDPPGKFVVPLPAMPKPTEFSSVIPDFPMVSMEDANARIIRATQSGFEQGCRAAAQAAFQNHVGISLN